MDVKTLILLHPDKQRYDNYFMIPFELEMFEDRRFGIMFWSIRLNAVENPDDFGYCI